MSESSPSMMGLLALRLWRGLAAVLALVCAVIWLGGAALERTGRLPVPMQPLVFTLVTAAGWIAGLYGLWWLLALAETLLRRMRAVALPTAQPHVLALRVPRPVGKNESLHAAQATQQGAREAQAMAGSLRQVCDLLETGHPERLSLEWWGGPTRRVTMVMALPGATQALHLLRSLWAGAAPGSDVTALDDPLLDTRGVLAWAECRMTADPTLPLRMVSEGDGDGLSAMIGALVPQADVRHVGVQLVLTGPPRSWRRSAARASRWTHLTAQAAHDRPETQAAQAMELKAQDRAATIVVRVLVRAATPGAALAQRQQMVALLAISTAQRGATRQCWQVTAHGVTAADAPAPPSVLQRWITVPQRWLPAPWPTAPRSVVCPAELALLWHWPSARHRAQVAWRANTYLPPEHAVLGAPIPILEEC